MVRDIVGGREEWKGVGAMRAAFRRSPVSSPSVTLPPGVVGPL